LIDDTHENAYLVSSEAPTTFEKLIKAFEEEGFSVSLSSVVGFKPDDYAVVLIAVPRSAFSELEKDSLSVHLCLGGKLIILGEFYPYYNNSSLNSLTNALGIDIRFINNKILDEENNYSSVEHWVTTSLFESHRITSALDKIALFGACSLDVGNSAKTVSYAEATAHPQGEASLESMPLIAVANSSSGMVIAIGDTNVFANDTDDSFPGTDDYIDTLDNLKLIRNIIDW